jgi:hypothetical protein
VIARDGLRASSHTDRARHYLAKMDPAISGAGGHTATFRAATALVVGFGLDQEEALDLLYAEYNPRCRPPWSKKELSHKVRSALKAGRQRCGYLLAPQDHTLGLNTTSIQPQTELPPERPPLDELHGFLRQCVRVTEDEHVGDWLRYERGIDPQLVAERWLALALIGDDVSFPWCDFWHRSGFRLVLPLWDAYGRPLSVRARLVGRGKAMSPSRYSPKGLIMADSTGRVLLEQGPSGPPRTVVVAEGEPDFLTWATQVRHGSSEIVMPTDTAVFGIFSGSWSDELATRIPTGSKVAIRTHNDKTGDRYAATIAKSLQDRCDVYRLRATL